MALAEAWEIVTVTESAWDDQQRGLIESLVTYERGICDCGFHESVAGDEGNHFRLEVRTCPVCASAARFDRMQAAADDTERGKEPPADREDPADGRTVGMRHLGRVTPPTE